ncbi:hypothetical protein LTR53_010309 [Teratosphaeriaceae sp. CCFEE 6253]|nr:hypothetical protein LTR53_010309 [Teratosphaeriaceae sp. CCFEE 6253]
MSTASSPLGAAAASPKFAPFSITDITYKTVAGTPIKASILIAKSTLNKPTQNKRPLNVRFHGGFLVTGSRLFADWYPSFVLDLCLLHDAVAVTVDYRLMPEAKGVEILEDIKDFYAWLLKPGNLAAHLPRGIEVDLDNIFVSGESAGGYLAFHAALIAPAAIRAVIMHYPMLDLRDPHYTQAYVKQLFDPPAPQIPPQVLANHLVGLKGTEVVTSATPPDRVPLTVSIIQQGRTAEFLGDDRGLYPLELLEDGAVSEAGLPPMWILHGKHDSAVPVDGTYRFVEKLLGAWPDAQLHVTIEDGEHGFDNHAFGTGEAATLETAWVKEGVEFVQKYWPAAV